MTTETIKVKSIEEYIQRVIGLSDFLKLDVLYDEYLLFRGQSSKNFELMPSLGRCPTYSASGQMTIFERKLIEEAKNKHPSIFANNLNPLDMLAKMQHYGIPTRLMDVTINPLVALYFACVGNDTDDGEVIVFRDKYADVNYPIIYAIADSYRFAYTSITYLDHFLEKVLQQPYFLEQKIELVGETGTWVAECCAKPLFISALELSPRQKAQQGKYILFSNEIQQSNGENYFTDKITAIPKDANYIETIIQIDNSSKAQIKKGLSVLGITESSLFADAVDISCKEIANRQIERIKNSHSMCW